MIEWKETKEGTTTTPSTKRTELVLKADISLVAAREAMKERVGDPGGVYCPCCNAVNKVYARGIHWKSGVWLCQLVRRYMAEQRWYAVRNLAELEAQVRDAGAVGQPVLLDLYADWCISCKVMEREVFPRPDVASRLAQFRLLRADVTENNAQDQELLEAFGLFGPPSLVFFGEDGSEMSEVRVQGEIGADALAAHLGAVLGQFGNANVGEFAANFGQNTDI